MYISFDGFEEVLKTIVKLFIIGLVAIIIFNIAMWILPVVLVGFVTVYTINYLGKNNRKRDVTKVKQ
ncbi:hypothetical protein KHQ82_03815 [Mycoplasmatota bacterium]|nr:hypothetical protein KHQ82_03815 [Mycoplasmatota bacterium]